MKLFSDMDTQEVNNLISFVACAIFEGNKRAAIFAAKGLDCPKEIKDHIIDIFTNTCDNAWWDCE